MRCHDGAAVRWGRATRFGGFAGLQARRPGLVVLLGFAAAILVLTLLLLLPTSREPGQPPSFVLALFTATSAICVTGLAVVDTPSVLVRAPARC